MCTQKARCEMKPSTGRPKADSPKDIQLKIRADKQLIKDLSLCCEKTGMNKSDVIRLGIHMVKQSVKKK